MDVLGAGGSEPRDDSARKANLADIVRLRKREKLDIRFVDRRARSTFCLVLTGRWRSRYGWRRGAAWQGQS